MPTKKRMSSSGLPVADPKQLAETLSDLANMRDDGYGHFLKRWGEFYSERFYPPDELVLRRDELRLLWNTANGIKTVPAKARHLVEAWVTGNEVLGTLNEFICSQWLAAEGTRALTIRWNRQERSIHASRYCLPGVLMMGCLLYSERLRICGNPQCLTSYYIASRKTQRYCSNECAAPAKREAKRRWWKENRGKGKKTSSTG